MGGDSIMNTLRNINIAINICTYRREMQVKNNLSKLLSSKFFDATNEEYYLHMHIFVVDNGNSLDFDSNEFVSIIHNTRNSGGSGGFQKGIEAIRKANQKFTHVVFMDDDVEFEHSCFYTLYDFLKSASEENIERPIAGRMFRTDDRNIQYTAAEKWNAGIIEHIGFMKHISDVNKEPDVILNSDADYGGWWLCCFPYSFVKNNDVMPFFIHCDDVEYGLRCQKKPIILKGFQVWHETYEYRISPIMTYYDTRNPLFVNERYNMAKTPKDLWAEWKEKISIYHVDHKWDYEYYTIIAMLDYLKGFDWLYRIDAEKKHTRLKRARVSRYKNSILWRIAGYMFCKKFKLNVLKQD